MEKKVVPDHVRISDWFIQRMRNQELRSGEKLPSLNRLVEQFKADRNVVIRAISRLENLGWVTTISRKGCYVNERPKLVSSVLSRHSRYSTTMTRLGEKPNSHLLDWVLDVPSLLERECLELSEHEQVYRLEILRFAGEAPLTLSTNTLPAKRVPDLERELPNFRSLHDLLKFRYGMDVSRKYSILETYLPLSGDAQWLEIPENIPIFGMRTVNVDEAGHAVELSVARMRGDRLQYRVEF